MYFFNPIPQESRSCQSSLLHRCGIEIPREEIKNIRRFIEESLEYNEFSFSSSRQEIYNYAFGEEIPFDQLQNEILSALEMKSSHPEDESLIIERGGRN
jgi:hypothetical protein